MTEIFIFLHVDILPPRAAVFGTFVKTQVAVAA